MSRRDFLERLMLDDVNQVGSPMAIPNSSRSSGVNASHDTAGQNLKTKRKRSLDDENQSDT